MAGHFFHFCDFSFIFSQLQQQSQQFDSAQLSALLQQQQLALLQQQQNNGINFGEYPTGAITDSTGQLQRILAN